MFIIQKYCRLTVDSLMDSFNGRFWFARIILRGIESKWRTKWIYVHIDASVLKCVVLQTVNERLGQRLGQRPEAAMVPAVNEDTTINLFHRFATYQHRSSSVRLQICIFFLYVKNLWPCCDFCAFLYTDIWSSYVVFSGLHNCTIRFSLAFFNTWRRIVLLLLGT